MDTKSVRGGSEKVGAARCGCPTTGRLQRIVSTLVCTLLKDVVGTLIANESMEWVQALCGCPIIGHLRTLLCVYVSRISYGGGFSIQTRRKNLQSAHFDGNRAVVGRAVAKLPVVVASPAKDNLAKDVRAGEFFSYGYLSVGDDSADEFDRIGAVGGGSVAELSVQVVSPANELAQLSAAGVPKAGREVVDRIQRGDNGRSVLVVGRAVAELAVEVVSPTTSAALHRGASDVAACK